MSLGVCEVLKWLEANDDQAKFVISTYLRNNPLVLKSLNGLASEEQQQQIITSSTSRRHRLSVVSPPSLLNTDGTIDPKPSLTLFTNSTLLSPRKSTSELRKLNKNDLFMELLRDVVSPDFDINNLSHKILVNVLILINADRSSLFLVEGPKDSPILVSRLFDVTERSSLESVVHDESEAIKIPFGVGIVGRAAQTGQVINLADAYKDPHFNTKVDLLTGYRTKAILCMPLKTSAGEVIGVAQVINKKDSEEFTTEDIEVFSMYLTFCAIGLINAQLFEQTITHSQRLQSLLELTKKLFEDTTSMEEILKCIMGVAQTLIPCDNCVVFVVDNKEKKEVKFCTAVQSKDNTVKSVDPSLLEGLRLVQHVAKTFEIMNITGQESEVILLKDSSTCVLCGPVCNEKGDLLAVVKMENKLNGLPFNQTEQESFQVFSMFCGLAIHNVINYEKMQVANTKQSVALEVLSYHASASVGETEHYMTLSLPNVDDIKLTSFSFDDMTLSDDMTVLASVVMFKELGFLNSFHINQKSLVQWVLTVRKNYRPVLYHNWRHAFNVAQTMFTLLTKGQMYDHLTDVEKLSLLVACFAHDLDHRGTNNAFQSKIDSPLAQLYSTSTMEHHHFDHCIMILNCDNNRFLEGLSSETYERLIRFIESAILATDLAMYFKRRDHFFDMIKKGQYNPSDSNDRDLLRGMLMTACDVAAVSKPWHIQRRVADLVTLEFFEQGDKERDDLNLTPVAMMDRQRKDELPHMQIGFIKSVCVPLFETLGQVNSNVNPLLNGSLINMSNWEEQVNSPIHTLPSNGSSIAPLSATHQQRRKCVIS